jgi:hypothetical protein
MHRFNYLTLAIITLLTLSSVALGINFCIYRYPGNDYYPPDTLYIALSLCLIYVGFFLQFGKESNSTQIAKEMIYFFLIMALLAFATNAIQYTPFPTIDQHLLTFETFCHVNTPAMLAWIHAKPMIKGCLEYIYNSLDYQMAFIPLVVILTKRFYLLREYYFLLVVSALIGFSFYYFFPTTAPASILSSDYFNAAQKATGIKFLQIHEYTAPTTINGGLIALPSFHTIWAWFCLYIAREWKVVFFTLLPINLLLIISCIVLGWHYSVDILGGIFIIVITHSMYRIFHKTMDNSPHHPEQLDRG